MKRYNKFDYNMLLVGILLPMLLFCISLNASFAYFTASTKQQEANHSTGIVAIKLTEVNGLINSNVVTNQSTLIPGENLIINGTILNCGTEKCYVILEVKMDVQKEDSSTLENLSTKYYTIVDNNPISIYGSEDNYSALAFEMEAPNANQSNVFTQDFNIEYNFSFNKFDNSYKNAKITYSLKAFAIQHTGISNAQTATNLLMDKIDEIT